MFIFLTIPNIFEYFFFNLERISVNHCQIRLCTWRIFTWNVMERSGRRGIKPSLLSLSLSIVSSKTLRTC